MAKPLRALIVEDSEDDTQLLLRELRRLGYDVEFERVETAEAMELTLMEKTWDVILSDYSMPRFSALQALDLLKTSHLDLPLIIISGTIGEETAVAALKAGANDFLIKGKFARLGPAIERELRDAESRLERKRAEKALRENEEKLRLFIEHAPVALAMFDREMRYLAVSQRWLVDYGLTDVPVLGHSHYEIFPEVPERWKVIHQRGLAGEVIRADEDNFQRVDGSLHVLRWEVRPWYTASGEVGGIVIFTEDVTERKKAEEALHKKNEELKAMTQQLWQAAKLATMGELAASIAHELNNPLAIVSLRAEMLQAQFSPEDPQSKSLQVIDSEIRRMSSLVANLLQFSRRSSSQISTIRVNAELTSTLELVQYHLRKNSIRTVQELAPDVLLVQADRQQLRQVFLNLFTNAADAMPLGGLLTIRTWAGEKSEAGSTAPLRASTTQSLGLPISHVPQVFVEVSDTGEGIPVERLERIWEPFYTTKPEGKGTGLGLAICRRIIQEHGGTIKVISEGIPGKGTTVRITLPAVRGG